jgi:hypothetical protein
MLVTGKNGVQQPSLDRNVKLVEGKSGLPRFARNDKSKGSQ